MFVKHISMLASMYSESKAMGSTSVRKFLAMFKDSGSFNGLHHQHDRRILERVSDLEQNASKAHLPFEKSSVGQLPVPRIFFPKSMSDSRKPQNMSDGTMWSYCAPRATTLEA